MVRKILHRRARVRPLLRNLELSKKAFPTMNFMQLIAEISASPIPVEVVEGLKRYIRTDKAYLTAEVKSDSPGVTVLHIAARYGDLDFFKWLIAEGANPRLMANKSWRDAAYLATFDRKTDFLRYLLQSCGKELFYDQATEGILEPHWWRLQEALEFNDADIARFLLEEAGYASYLGARKLNLAWQSSFQRSDNREAIAAIYLTHNLLDDLEAPLYIAIGCGELAVGQQILARYKGPINMTKLIQTTFDNESLSRQSLSIWIHWLLATYPSSDDELCFILSKLESWSFVSLFPDMLEYLRTRPKFFAEELPETVKKEDTGDSPGCF